MDVLKTMFYEIDLDEVTKNVKWLTENTPYRISGSRDEAKAAEYVTKYLSNCGLETENEQIYVYNSFPQYSKLEIVSPISKVIESLPCAHIKSTDINGEILDLVYVGNGSYDSYKGLEVDGKFVLVEVSYAPPVPEKARIAYEMGAVGIVCMNWGNDEEVICNRGLKAVWGNPTEETFTKIPDIFGIGVTRNSGLMLKELCQNGNVKIKVIALADKKWEKVNQPKGILRGNGDSDEFLLVSSHLDAWKPGVTCNATGDSTALEICRILSKHKEKLKRDVWFVFWNGHEIAEAAGSTWFVDNYWDKLNKKCVGYINIDSTGVKDATIYEIKSSDELHDFSFQNAKELLGKEIRMMDLKKIGDQSFMGIGIPAVAQRMSFTKEYMERNHGATLGWWNHTKEDGIDKYDEKNMEVDIQVTLSLIYRMCIVDILPYEFDNKFDQIQKNIDKTLKCYDDKINFSDLYENLLAAKESVLKIQRLKHTLKDSQQIKSYNKFVIKVSRYLTNIFQTYSDKYQQDSYGYTKLSAPIPLFADLNRLNNHEESTIEYGMIETQIIKNKNRINDALNNIVDLAEVYNKII